MQVRSHLLTGTSTGTAGAQDKASSPPPPTTSDGPVEVRDRFVPSLVSVNQVEPPALRSTWQQHLLARVGDASVGAAVDSLFEYHQACAFFGERILGMRRLTLDTAEGALDVQLAPHRNKVPVAEVHVHGQAECALCKPPFVDERGLRWRDYSIWPNAYPYLPPEQQHVVITAATHQGQHFAPRILEDMIDYQRAAGQATPVTLHYNGVAGNSQFHLHWQASRERLPLQRLLDEGSLPLQRVHSGAGGRVESYDQGFYAGLLVSGDKAYVSRMATRIVAQLERDPVTRGAYNLLLLHPRQGEARLVVIPRRADMLQPELPSFGKVGLGAFSFGGTIVVPREQLPDGFAGELCTAARQTLVRPSELGWLDELREQVDNAVLALRTARSDGG